MTAKITTKGLNVCLERIFKATPSYTTFSNFRVGTDSTAPAASDTTLGSQIPITTDTTIDSCDAVTGWAHSGEADAEVVNDTAGEYKEGTGCLNLPTTYSTGAVAEWTKTVTTFDMSTTGDTVGVFFYIAESDDLTTDSDAVRITLGTGGMTDTNYWSFANTTISDGWNYLEMTGTPTGTEGTGADETDIDTVKISVLLDSSQTTNDMRMDFWHLARTADYLKAVMTGYPTLNETTNIATIRTNVASTEANGHSIVETNIENTDDTIKQLIRATHTVVSKTSKEAIIYEHNYKLQEG